MKRGFTLVELMVLIVIIGLLAAMAIPAYQKVKAEHTRRGEAHSETRGYESRTPEYITIDGKRYRLIRE